MATAGMAEIPNCKHQGSNKPQGPNSNTETGQVQDGQQAGLGHSGLVVWSLFDPCCLLLGASDFVPPDARSKLRR
jgi:hypothetical protein